MAEFFEFTDFNEKQRVINVDCISEFIFDDGEFEVILKKRDRRIQIIDYLKLPNSLNDLEVFKRWENWSNTMTSYMLIAEKNEDNECFLESLNKYSAKWNEEERNTLKELVGLRKDSSNLL